MSHNYAYQAVYDYVARLVGEASGERQVRLPSLRDLAGRLSVSVSTVQHAYQLLESEGRIASVAKSGYFAVVVPLPVMPGAPAVQVAPADLLQSIYHHACSPGMGNLHRSDPWPAEALGKALTAREREIQRQHRSPASHPLGEPALRRQLAARYTQATHHRWCADDVYLGVDLRAMLDITLDALGIRDRTVLIQAPITPVMLAALRHAGARLCELPLAPCGTPDIQQTARCLDTQAVALAVLNSRLNGPHGTQTPDPARQAVAQLLDEHGTWVLEDDDHSELAFDSLQPLRDWVAPERLLVCGSFARTLGAEAPYGYLLAAPQACGALAQEVRKRLLQRDYPLPPVRQKAVARLYQRGAMDAQLRTLRAALRLNVGRLVQQFDDHLGDLLVTRMPAGGSGLWLHSRCPIDARQVYERLVQRRILIAPGPAFSSRGHHPQCLRIACPVNGLGLSGRVIAELRKALLHGRV